jgi:hypothetical protein
LCESRRLESRQRDREGCRPRAYHVKRKPASHVRPGRGTPGTSS